MKIKIIEDITGIGGFTIGDIFDAHYCPMYNAAVAYAADGCFWQLSKGVHFEVFLEEETPKVIENKPQLSIKDMVGDAKEMTVKF